MTLVAIILGPVFAVIITLWYQSRREKRDLKQRVFFELIAHRKSYPIPQDFVKALNLIDVVFHKNRKVISLWHEYYGILHQQADEKSPILDLRDQKLVELLSEMARVLGYKNLQQVDIDKFYTPIAHQAQFLSSEKLLKEFQRVLENTSRFVTEPKPKNDKNDKK
jgi:hypothetical protein